MLQLILSFCFILSIFGQEVPLEVQMSVPIGRFVYLDPKLINVTTTARVICKIEVVKNEPMTQRVGFLEPQTFDCNFKHGTVSYTHMGNPLLYEDIVKLTIYKFSDTDTLKYKLVLKIQIQHIPYNIFEIRRPIQVNEFYGYSDKLSIHYLNFKFNKNEGATCMIRFSRYSSAWPMYGRIVHGNYKQKLDSMQKDCDDFFSMDIQYEHLQPPSPNIDFIPLRIEVRDPTAMNYMIVERMFLPIHIIPAFPNMSPKPAFASTYLMDVDQFILTTISTVVLSAKDVETLPEQVIFNISKPLKPKEGQIVHINDITKSISSFSQADLLANNIAYKPPSDSYPERRVYEVMFTAFDSHFNSSEPMMVHIGVRSSSTNAPRVSVNSGLTLLEGQSRPIHTSNLEIVDHDNIENVQIYVTGGLKHGRLEVNKKRTIMFTPHDLKVGNVVYYHDDSDSDKDSIELRIFDGRLTSWTKFPINIIQKDDSPPSLVTNMELKLQEGDAFQITKEDLKATDKDSPDDQIIFVILNPPKAGSVWKRLPWENTGRVAHSFTQRELEQGLIYYRHLGDEVFSDFFELVLKDTVEPPNESEPYKVMIRIEPVGDSAPERSKHTVISLNIKETDVHIFTKQELRYIDVDTHDKEITYTITVPPFFVANGRKSPGIAGKIVSTSNRAMLMKDPSIPELLKFTQEEINHLQIAYIPPMEDIGPKMKQVQFVFSVSDNHKNKVTNQIFNITLLPVNNQSPKLHTGHVIVDEGGRTILSTSQISVYDKDTLSTDLKLKIKEVPSFGKILKDDVPLEVGSIFTMDDIMQLKISYESDGSEVSEDKFVILATDSLHEITKDIFVIINPVDDLNPVFLPDLLATLEIFEGETININEDILAATDEDTVNEILNFIIIDPPKYGTIIVGGRLATRFSQKEVTDGKVMYVHNGREIGPHSLNDIITFVVTDKILPSADLPKHKLTINIMPFNNKPPRLILGNSLMVDEGETVRIGHDVISALDDDTIKQDLQFVVSQEPKWGFIENVRPLPGHEKSNAGKSVSVFTLQDIHEGLINYVQSSHTGIEPRQDSFEIYITDGSHKSHEVNIPISIIPHNDEIPIVVLKNFSLSEGGHQIIDSNILRVSDRDRPRDLILISIITFPGYGKLTNSLKNPENGLEINTPILNFSWVEFGRSINLKYTHDNSENFHDTFTLLIFDGKHESHHTAHIDITPVNDEKPQIVKNAGLKNVHLGSNVLISSLLLQTVDDDNIDNELHYIITSLPRRGILQIVSEIDHTSWVTLKEGMGFTQEQLNNNHVQYIHIPDMGTTRGPDRFRFRVTDGVYSTPKENFEIEILDTPKSRLSLINTGMEVLQGAKEAIPVGALGATDNSNYPEEIIFTLTQFPSQGHIEHISNPNYPISSFNQLDLFGGKISYSHSRGNDRSEDSFNFIVNNGVRQKNGTFEIKIIKRTSLMPSLEKIIPITVTQGYSVPITSSNLQAVDIDTPSYNITYVISKHPRFGTLLNQGIKISDIFTQHDLDQGFIQYEANKTGHGLDHFLFKITDGINTGYLLEGKILTEPTRFEVIIDSDEKDFPSLVRINSPDVLENLYWDKMGFRFTKHNLQGVSRGTDIRYLIYNILAPPQYGHFELTGTRIPLKSSFSQKDINELRVLYILDSGTTATNDSFSFTLSDAKGNHVERQRMFLNWAVINFTQAEFIICENEDMVAIIVERSGALRQSSFVSINSRSHSAKETKDFIPSRIQQLQFDPGVTKTKWIVTIVLDEIEEDDEVFYVELSQPVNALLVQPRRTLINIKNAIKGKCTDDSIDLDMIPADSYEPYPKKSHQQIKPSSVLTSENGYILTYNGIRGVKTEPKHPYRESRILPTEESLPIQPPIAQVPDRPSCNSFVKSLLYLDPMTGRMFICDSREWIYWNPNVEDSRPTLAPPIIYLTTVLPSPYTLPKRKTCDKEWYKFLNWCYRVFDEQLSWIEAYKECQNKYKAQLTVIFSEEHNSWLLQLAGKNQFWIGFTSQNPKSQWLFLDNEEIKFSFWRPNFPRQSLPTNPRNCALVTSTGHWMNHPCTTKKAKFICSKDIEH